MSGSMNVTFSRRRYVSVFFVEPGAKVNSEYYCYHVLGGGLLGLPDIRARYQRYSWTLQQDGAVVGAPSNSAKNTLTYLRRENVTFIEPDTWPPNSPYLNPVDYAVWGAFQPGVYQRRRFTTINQLKQAIVIEWGKLCLLYTSPSPRDS